MIHLPRLISWIGSTQRELRTVPRQVRRDIGQALYAAQQGVTDLAARPLKGYGEAQSMEIVERYRSDRYWAIYRPFAAAVHVSRVYRTRKKTSAPREMSVVTR